MVNSQATDSSYRILPAKDCVAYVEQKGLRLDDGDWDLSIKSGKVQVCTLPNGEIVLIPLTPDETYPGIIFKDAATFAEFTNKDFFPIGEQYMTWLEANAQKVKAFQSDASIFASPLSEYLKVKVPYNNLAEAEIAYDSLLVFLKDERKSNTEKKTVVGAYGLSVMYYLLSAKSYTLSWNVKYEIYNPYNYPLLIADDGTQIDVLAKLYIAIQDRKKGSFKVFSRLVGI